MSLLDVTDKASSDKRHGESHYLQVRLLKDNESLLSATQNFSILNIYTHAQSPSSSLIYQMKEMAAAVFEAYLQVFVDDSQVSVWN